MKLLPFAHMGRKKTIENDKTFKINLLEIRKEEIFLTGNKCKLVELKSVIIFYADLSSKQDSYEYIYATQNSFKLRSTSCTTDENIWTKFKFARSVKN